MAFNCVTRSVFFRWPVISVWLQYLWEFRKKQQKLVEKSVSSVESGCNGKECRFFAQHFLPKKKRRFVGLKRVGFESVIFLSLSVLTHQSSDSRDSRSCPLVASPLIIDRQQVKQIHCDHRNMWIITSWLNLLSASSCGTTTSDPLSLNRRWIRLILLPTVSYCTLMPMIRQPIHQPTRSSRRTSHR